MTERRLTALLFALAFCVCGVPRVFTQTAAHALFIHAYGAAAMPWAYLAEALCVPLAGALYIAGSHRFSLRTLWVGTLAVHAVALLLLRAAVAQHWPLAAGAAIVYFEIEFVLSSLLLWGVANQCMTLRQGKRRFGHVSAGEPAAVIAGGLAMPLLLRGLAPADLLLLSAAGALAGIGLVVVLLRTPAVTAGDEADAGGAPATGTAQAPWWRQGYALRLAGMVAAGQLAYFFVDSAFYLEAGHAYPDAQALASFLGLYSAAVGAASLLAGAVLAPWVLRRFGVRGGMLVLPALLLVGAAAAVAGAGSGALLGLVVMNKVIDQSLRYTLDKSTFVTLLQPLPPGRRVRTQAALESIVEPLSGGVAALLLFGLFAATGAGAAGVAGAVLGAALAWCALATLQMRGYVDALRSAVGAPAAAAAPVATLCAATLRESLAAEVNGAAAVLTEWAALPARASRRAALEADVASRIDLCFTLLAPLAGPGTLVMLHAQYRRGDRAARSCALELLDVGCQGALDAVSKRRLFALLEPESMAERAALLAGPVRRPPRWRARAGGNTKKQSGEAASALVR